MTPSRLHVPPVPTGAPARSLSAPPSTSIRYSRSLAKNPIDRLSGDQNGDDAPSVFASGEASPLASERTHSIERPSCEATNATLSPSGDNAMDTGSVVGGVVISTRISAAVGAV